MKKLGYGARRGEQAVKSHRTSRPTTLAERKRVSRGSHSAACARKRGLQRSIEAENGRAEANLLGSHYRSWWRSRPRSPRLTWDTAHT
jgi:hypothetical protein